MKSLMLALTIISFFSINDLYAQTKNEVVKEVKEKINVEKQQLKEDKSVIKKIKQEKRKKKKSKHVESSTPVK